MPPYDRNNVFARILRQNAEGQAQSAAVLASDFAFREAIATGDTKTLVSALENHGARIKATAVFFVNYDGVALADSLHPEATGQRFAYPDLIALLMDRGVQIQGYLVSRPLKATTVPAFLAESRRHLEQLMRTTPAECAEIGRELGRKLSQARGPAALLVPRQGVSAIDGAGQPFDGGLHGEAGPIRIAGVHRAVLRAARSFALMPRPSSASITSRISVSSMK